MNPSIVDQSKSSGKEALSPDEIDRLVVLAIKHCPSDHADWDELCRLYDKVAIRANIESNKVRVSGVPYEVDVESIR